MIKLKLGCLLDDKPVRMNVELSASVHRDLTAYADAIARESGQPVEPTKLIAPMLARFMAGDRAFSRARKASSQPVPLSIRGAVPAAQAAAPPVGEETPS